MRQFYETEKSRNPLISWLTTVYTTVRNPKVFECKNTKDFYDIFDENTNERRFMMMHGLAVNARAAQYIKMKYNNAFVDILFFIHSIPLLFMGFIYIIYLEIIGALNGN